MASQSIAAVEAALADVLGDGEQDSRAERRRAAQRLGESAGASLGLQQQQLVYGELDVAGVAKLLDAAEVRDGDRFLDIGSGDGLPTLAAALLYPDTLRVCRGIELVAALADRAGHHADRLRQLLSTADRGLRAAPIELLQGDIYAATTTSTIADALRDTTIALCFATTWSSAPRRTLPRLSTTLHAGMAGDARIILVDARLEESDGWRWEGDLRITTPDTAPYSTARLYTRVALG
jgi:hypothetical protein